MYPVARTLFLGPPKTLGQSARRNLHLMLAATPRRKCDLLLRGTRTPSANWSRCFCEEFVKSQAAKSAISVLAQNPAVYAVQEKLIAFHEASGLPWWAVIVTSTFAVRALLVMPVAAHQQYIVARLVNLQTEMDTTVKAEVTATVAKEAAEKRWDAKTSDQRYHRLMRERRLQLYRRYNCHPAKNSVLLFVQVPVWVTMSAAIRNISQMLPTRDAVAVQAYLEMTVSGFSILKDLTVPDETFLLPALVVATNMLLIQLNVMVRLRRRNAFRAVMLALIRLCTLLSFPFIMYMPKCMTLYWLSSSLFGFLQNILFIHPRTRRLMRIPHYDSLRKDPFEYIKNRFKSIYYFFKY